MGVVTPLMAPPAGAARFELPLRIYYEDTDAGGIVYHASYLRFAERGRTEMLRRLGYGQQELRAREGLGFAVGALAIAYKEPAVLDDELTLVTALRGLGGASLNAWQGFIRQDRIIVALEVRVACVGRSGRPQRLPADMVAAFRPLLGADPEPAKTRG